MQTQTQIELNPLTILKHYEKYDIGETPYVVKKAKDGGIEIQPYEVFNVIKFKKQQSTGVPVRQAVLDLIKEWKITQINQLIDDMVYFLLVEPEKLETKYFDRPAQAFSTGKMQFLRFLLDLPYDLGRKMLKDLIKEGETKNAIRDFQQMLDVSSKAPNPIVDVVLRYYDSETKTF